MAEIVGISCIGIGADFIDYAIDETIAEMEERGIPYADSDFLYPDGIKSWASLPRLLEGMAGRGFSADEVAQVAGENLLRVMADVETAAG
jgi:microsomal dipeptidase-like Zn-dependent dipeptidase